MNIKVSFFAQLGQAAGTRQRQLEVDDGRTVQDVVRALAAEYGGAFRELVLAGDDRLQPTVLVFVGEEQVDWGTAAPLSDGDEILLVTPIAGG